MPSSLTRQQLLLTSSASASTLYFLLTYHREMRSFLFPRCGIIFSSALIVIGLFFLFVFPSLFTFFSNKEFLLSKQSQSFKHWSKTPIPVTMDFYFFNWTNPKDIYNANTKPIFVELGPYRFYETRVKVNVTWNENSTITYRQLRTWHFSPEESVGSLDDDVTTINAVSLTAASRSPRSSLLNFAFGVAQQKISVTNSLRKLLFDGYEDTLVSVANTFRNSPFDKFGWFYNKNASFKADGWFNLQTGAEDISKLGRLSRWNHKNHTGFYQGSCGEVNGFTGDMFPPGLIRRESRFHLYSQDLCRSVPLSYETDMDVRGILGHKFTTRLDEVDDTNACSCRGICEPSGLVNLTSCRYGAPVFVSLPHFFTARPYYLAKLKGLWPKKEKHEFFATIEPTFGVPIDVRARAQLNMHLQPFKDISLYRRAPDMMFPVLWVDQRARITEPLARELRTVLMLPVLAAAAGVFSLTLGSLLFIVTLVLRRLDGKVNLLVDVPASSAVPQTALT